MYSIVVEPFFLDLAAGYLAGFPKTFQQLRGFTN